jgi:UDP-glucose 4-epimerase
VLPILSRISHVTNSPATLAHGSHMVLELLDVGEQVVVLDNLSNFRRAVAENVPIVVGDAGDQALVSRLIREYGIEAILHFAASLVVSDSVRDPTAY